MTITEITLTIVLSSGLTSGVIFGVSKWIGNIISDKLIEKDKARYNKELEDFKSIHNKELEGVKSKYSFELESQKKELETSKLRFLKYSESQFNLYNDLWKELIEVKYLGEELWNELNPVNLKNFAEQLHKTKKTLEKSALLIEENHYNRLLVLIDNFSKFEMNKKYLIDYRKKKISDISTIEIGEYAVVINRQTREDYTSLLTDLKSELRHQINGK